MPSDDYHLKHYFWTIKAAFPADLLILLTPFGNGSHGIVHIWDDQVALPAAISRAKFASPKP